VFGGDTDHGNKDWKFLLFVVFALFEAVFGGDTDHGNKKKTVEPVIPDADN